MDDLRELYSDLILDHSENPRCCGDFPHDGKSVHKINTLCGDEITLCASVLDSKINCARFTGSGCSISQAAASMLTEEINGKDLLALKQLSQQYRAMILGTDSSQSPPPGDLVALSGMRALPARHRCALLAVEALDALCAELEKVRS